MRLGFLWKCPAPMHALGTGLNVCSWRSVAIPKCRAAIALGFKGIPDPPMFARYSLSRVY